MKLSDIFSCPPQQPLVTTPFMIAEAGVNHEGNMDTARRLIDEAAEGGADAIKFQTYKAATLASKNSPAYWDTSKEPTQSQYELFRKHDSFWKNDYEALKKHCESAGIAFLSTPFDIESARFLNDLMEAFKISSSDITNKPFIRILCDFKKPILLSTGAAHLHEIAEAVGWIEEKGNKLALLHCVLNYPTADENANLGMICALRQHFPQHVIGYSDHTLPDDDMRILTIATLLGARVLEKHFSHDKSLPGNDHYHAMDRHDLKHFYAGLAAVLASLGSWRITALPEEEPARRHARRSLVTARAVPAGKILSPKDLTWKRPAHGISPRHYDEVLVMRARRTLPEDTALVWSDLDAL
ncbi:MAG: N-acetylneuraminate synthase family protein [Desulfovibrio sp.]|nr:N-acetylneuraminate synthase family protein [Desulfovibrio sp.]